MGHELDLSEWQPFLIADLFEVTRPAARSENRYQPGTVPFVASGAVNNGVVSYCQPHEDEELDEPNCIVISPVDGYASYQPDPFLGRGGGGSSMIILRSEKLNETRGLFLCALIRKRCSEWTYNDMGSSKKIKTYEIDLPVDSDGEPDWNFMDRYMSEMRDLAERRLHLITMF